MGTVTATHILGLLALVSIAYALWVVYYFEREKYKSGKEAADEEKSASRSSGKKKKDIVGKSTFVLTDRKTAQNTAKEPGIEEDKEKAHTFAESKAPEHPRQIPPDELDDAFGETPPGEDNSPMEIDVTLPDEETHEPDAGEDEDEDLPLTVRPGNGSATIRTKTFEEMGEAYRAIVHDPPLTEDEKRDTGRILLELTETDMFEAIVSGRPEREDKINRLIDSYLNAFHQKMQAEYGESPSPRSVPFDFDIRDHIEPTV